MNCRSSYKLLVFFQRIGSTKNRETQFPADASNATDRRYNLDGNNRRLFFLLPLNLVGDGFTSPLLVFITIQ